MLSPWYGHDLADANLYMHMHAIKAKLLLNTSVYLPFCPMAKKQSRIWKKS